jgi:hypothetical protein
MLKADKNSEAGVSTKSGLLERIRSWDEAMHQSERTVKAQGDEDYDVLPLYE